MAVGVVEHRVVSSPDVMVLVVVVVVVVHWVMMPMADSIPAWSGVVWFYGPRDSKTDTLPRHPHAKQEIGRNRLL